MEIVRIDGKPVFEAKVDSEDAGMLRISLVDDPAVQSDFLAFNNTAPRRLLYAIEDEEKRLILGVVMRADFPIYRKDESLGEYYIIYRADTIREMAEKYLADNRQNLVNLMHKEGTDVEGVQMVQYFIKGGGLAPLGFDDIADGSLFAEFHVTNDDVWKAIKEGTYKGFSLEGLFDLVPEQNKTYVEEVVDILEGKFREEINPLNLRNMKNKKKGLLARLAAALVREAMGNVTTDKGILAWDSSDDLKAGDNVYIQDTDGGLSPAPDGTYTTGDGKKIIVAGGEVSEIIDDSAEVGEGEGEGENFASAATDKGTLEWDEGKLEAGKEVFITDEDGNRNPAPDGEYRTEDGKVIVVVDGKVAEIRDDSAEVAPQDTAFHRIAQAFAETYEEKYKKIYEAIAALGFDPYGYIVEAADDFAVYCTWGESGDKYTRFEVSWDADGNAIVSNPVEVKPAFVEKDAPVPAEEIENLRNENASLRSQLETLRKTPAAKPAHQEFNESGTPVKTGIRGLDNLSRIMSAM